MTKENTTDVKTHWLYSPNKNYFGHQDLPNGEDVVLTIKSANWETVKNPKENSSQTKRIVRFKENFKPLICNETNANAIYQATGERFMEETINKKIKIGISKTREQGTKKEDQKFVDCLRVRRDKSSDLDVKSITSQQVKILNDLAEDIGFDISRVCKGYKIKDISTLPSNKFDAVVKGLEKKRGTV